MTDQQYMQLAYQEALAAYQENEIPIGAIIVYEDKIIGRGHNTRENSHQVTGHAEMNAIQQACDYMKSWKLDNCKLYVTAEPCPMCAGAIVQARIKDVYYGADDLKAGAFGGVYDLSMIQGLNHYPLIHRGIMKEECKDLLQSFFKKLRAEKVKQG